MSSSGPGTFTSRRPNGSAARWWESTASPGRATCCSWPGRAPIPSNWAAGWLGPENVRRVKVRWKEQVWPGDVLTFSGKVARRYEEGGERRVDLDLVCTKQDGGVAVTGWATFVVPAG